MATQNPIAAPPVPVTLAEFAALPEYPRYELVKGELVELMVASDEHEETVMLVGHGLLSHALPLGLGKVYGSNRGYVTGPDTSRMPDVSFISTERLRPDIVGKLYDGAPDLAVEILSDGNTAAEINRKIAEYLNAGGKAVWVIDVDVRTLIIHTPDAPPQILADADTVNGGDYLPGFVCLVADLLPSL